jgi:hypothetical protein
LSHFSKKDDAQYSSHQQKMPYHPSYHMNLVTQQKQKQNQNQLCWKYRQAWSSTPRVELLSQRARDEAYKLLQLSVVMFVLLQVTYVAYNQRIQLQAA